MTPSALSNAERRFFEELNARGVRFMIVGLTAAIAQGANTVTRDIDLWFETTSDHRIGEAARAAGGLWTSGFGMMPAMLGGAFGDRFDVVFNISGLQRFEDEYVRAKIVTIDGVEVPVIATDDPSATRRRLAWSRSYFSVADDERLQNLEHLACSVVLPRRS